MSNPYSYFGLDDPNGKSKKEANNPFSYFGLDMPEVDKPHEPTSSMGDFRRMEGETPLPDDPPLKQSSTWDQVKAGDIKGIGSEIALGLSQGLAKTGSARQNEDIANLLTKNTLPGMADMGRQQLAEIQANKEYLEANPADSLPAMLGKEIPSLPLWMTGEKAVVGAAQGIGKLAPRIASVAEKVPGFIKGGLTDATAFGTVVAPTQNLSEGGSIQDLIEREKQLPGVLFGGVAARGALKGISKGVEGARDVLKPRGVPLEPIAQSPAMEPLLRPREPIQASRLQQELSAPRIELPTGGPLDRFQIKPDQRIRGSVVPGEQVPGGRTVEEIPKVGESAAPIGEPINSLGNRSAATSIESPSSTLTLKGPDRMSVNQPQINERQFAQNIRDSKVAPDEIKANLDENPLTYEPITNKETYEKAQSVVGADSIKARELFDAPSKGINADDVALGEALIVKAIKDGDNAGANKLIAELAEKLTTAGQAVQAASIFKRLSPEGMLLYAQRTVNSANKDILKRLGTKANKIELTPEDSQFITDTMQRVQSLDDGREKDIAMAQIMKLISEKVPATLSDKVKGLQRISLLLNPKSMVRNILGNTVFGAVDNASNVLAAPIDAITSKILKTNRTTSLPNPLKQLKSMKEGAKLTVQDAKLGIDTYNNPTQYEFSDKRVFDNKVLNALDRGTVTGLKLGDTPFHKAAYDDVLRQMMKLAKVDKPTQEMIAQAQKTATQRTYQDVNAMTEGFKMAQQSLNKISSAVGLGSSEFGLGNIVMPFVKTPANILKRAVEYSPTGVATALREATKIKKGTFDQKAFVDSISRSVTGTAIIMVGYDLAKKGIITGSGNKDKDVAAFERGLGKEDYAFKVGDNLYTYSWMQPASMALAIGADIFLKGKDRKEAENVVVDAVKSGGETLFKQSLLQGVTRFMSGYSPMDNLATTALNAPNQFVPTIGKQISQVLDPTQRSTYSPTNLGTEKNLIKSKIPGLTSSLEPKINTSGETMQNFQGKNSLFNIFVNPGTSTEFKPNKVQKEILRIYESTGDNTIFPKIAPKTLTNKGVSIQLTPQEITTFQRSIGKSTEEKMSHIVNMGGDDKKKAEKLADAIRDAYEESKKQLLKSRGIK